MCLEVSACTSLGLSGSERSLFGKLLRSQPFMLPVDVLRQTTAR